MNATPQFLEAVGQALAAPKSLASLRLLANRQIANGVTRDTLEAWFEQARECFPEHEDRLLETLDLVAGWCSPHQALDAKKKPGAGPCIPDSTSSHPVDVGKQG